MKELDCVWVCVPKIQIWKSPLFGQEFLLFVELKKNRNEKKEQNPIGKNQEKQEGNRIFIAQISLNTSCSYPKPENWTRKKN